MNRKFMALSLCVAGVGAFALHQGVARVFAQTGGAAPYIVVLQDDTANVPAVASEHARAYGLAVSRVYGYALKGYAAVIPQARLQEVRSDPRVAFISEDRPVYAFSQTLPTGIDRIDAEQRTGFSNNGGPAVAVLDTGSGPHPDLNVVGGVNCSNGNSYNDGNGHGSHVAGTIGAINNTDGVVGVAPGVPIYSVRVLNNSGSGSWSSVICGIDWVAGNAAAKGIAVANMSLGGSGSDGGDCTVTKEAMQKAICNATDAGVLFVVAAGNNAADFSGFVPAAYDQVLTVTAMADFNGQPGGGAAATCRTDVDDTSADFSNFTIAGSADASHTIAAPGVCILSTWKNGGYKTISGTSMASPHVAGSAAACVATDCAGMTPAQVMAKLRSDAAAQPASYGFVGDPYNPISTGGRAPKTAYFGYLVRALAY